MNLDELMSIAKTLPPDALDLLIKQARAIQNVVAEGKGSDTFCAPVATTTLQPEMKGSPAKPTRTRMKKSRPNCLKCGSTSVVLDGHRRGKQRYWCKSCNTTFLETTNTVMYRSHFQRSDWEQVIEDTFEGKSLVETAERLETTEVTIFNMRHKVLAALIKMEEKAPTKLENIAELDETYVLESYKGHKLNPETERAPRKRGSKASKPGLSEEQVCILSGVERNHGKAYATTVNRARPSKAEIREALSTHIEDGSVLFTDGLKDYGVLQEEVDCIINSVSSEQMKVSKTANLNNVNSFHSYVKERYHKYRGVATKYINRYNAMFASGFRQREEVVDEICTEILTMSFDDRSTTIAEILEMGLVEI